MSVLITVETNSWEGLVRGESTRRDKGGGTRRMGGDYIRSVGRNGGGGKEVVRLCVQVDRTIPGNFTDTDTLSVKFQ